MPPTSHLELVRANRSRRQEIMESIREIDDRCTTDGRGYTDEERADIDASLAEIGEIDDRITANLDAEIQTRALDDGISSMLGAMLDRDTGDLRDVRSLGQRTVQSESFQGIAGSNGPIGRRGVFGEAIDYRAVTEVTLGAGSAGELVRPDRLARIGQDFLDRRVFLTDLLPHIQVSTDSVEIPWDSTPLADLADKPTEVAEGSGKPQSGPTFDVVTEPIKTIAHWWDVTRQALADATMIQSYLDTRGRYALRRTVDRRVVAGPGGSSLLGLTGRDTLNHVAVSSEERYESIRKGITEMEEGESVPEIVVLNPVDAEEFDLSNHADDGLHAVPNVAGPGARTAWGLTQVRSNAIAPGFALLIDPTQVAILDRQAVSAYATDSDGDKFRSNVLTFLMECRVGLALFSQAGVCKVTFDGYSGSGS